MSAGWSTPDDIAAKVRRRWSDGSMLRAHAQGEPFPTIEVPLRGPKATEIGDDLEAARRWVSRLAAGGRSGARYGLEWAGIGGRYIGRNQVPSRAVVGTFEQAWTLLGVGADVRRFEQLLALTGDVEPVRAWAIKNPLLAVDLAEEWERLLAAYTWLQAHRGSGRYLREISVPGVDTKFAERHRAVLAGMLDVSRTPSGFLSGLGLRTKPELLRLRVSPGLGFPEPLTEVAARAGELAALPLEPAAALIVENEVTYLSVEVPDGGVVIWGKGFEVDRAGRLPWLADVAVTYWGDLGTHGFAILDRLRAWLPHTRSVLMDRETLVTHRDRWVTDERPAADPLTRLTKDESELYDDLVADRLADRIRLEQERIDWGWAQQRLSSPTVMSDSR